MSSASGNSTADRQESYGPQLGDIVKSEVSAVREFIEKLNQEQQALIAGEVELLSTLAEEKTALATQLNQFAERRHQLLSTAGLPAGRAGMESWLAEKTTSQASLQEWEQLLALASQAREINETNGKLIGTRLQHNQQTLNALLEANNKATLYGPDGQTRSSAGGRHFGAA